MNLFFCNFAECGYYDLKFGVQLGSCLVDLFEIGNFTSLIIDEFDLLLGMLLNFFVNELVDYGL